MQITTSRIYREHWTDAEARWEIPARRARKIRRYESGERGDWRATRRHAGGIAITDGPRDESEFSDFFAQARAVSGVKCETKRPGSAGECGDGLGRVCATE